MSSMGKIRLAHDIEKDSIVNGPGIRTVIWTQGCPHRCVGCHNPETHDCEKGNIISLELLFEELGDLDFQDGITFTGGEPFLQPEAILAIAKRYQHKNLWLYTGYEFKTILKMQEKNKIIKELMPYLDVIVDGRFEKDKKSLNDIFKGSTNQRIIDVVASLKQNKIVEKKFDNFIFQKQEKKIFL